MHGAALRLPWAGPLGYALATLWVGPRGASALVAGSQRAVALRLLPTEPAGLVLTHLIPDHTRARANTHHGRTHHTWPSCTHSGRRGAHLVGDQPRARHERRCLGRIADRGLAPLQHRRGRTLRRPPVAGPELGCCAPSSKLALALAALGDSAHPGGERGGPRSAQPRPRVLEPCSRLQRRRLHGLRSRAGMAAAAGDVILSGFASIYFERVLKSVEETYSVR